MMDLRHEFNLPHMREFNLPLTLLLRYPSRIIQFPLQRYRLPQFRRAH
jgi:hypothetical protein